MIRRAALVLIASLLVTLPGSAQELRRGKDYPGAAWLYYLDEIQVVYPAAQPETRERNRLSAERRAAFLTRAHGVRAAVVGDTEIDAEASRGNLLLLGWENRLLGTEEAPRPFERGESGVTFLGVSDPDPDADLLVFARSPYNPEKHLIFWSRIDPDLDRLMPLPVLGSDWAIYHAFRPIRQGMFFPGTDWPPVRDEEAEGDHRDTLETLRKTWKQTVTDHYRIFYDATSVSPRGVRAIGEARESAFAKAREVAGEPGKDFRIVLRVYADTEQKEELTGVPDPAHSVPSRRELHMTARYAQASSPHEEIHILAHHAIAPCLLTSLYEGFAIAEDGSYRQADLATHAATMLEEDTLPPLDHLLDEEAGRALPAGLRFPAAGLLAQWIRQEFPGERWPAVYGMTEGNTATLASVLGRPADSLEPLFRKWVKKKSVEGRGELAFIRAQEEAQRSYLAGDYEAVAAALRKALRAKPDEPQTMFNLASALMRTGDHAAARKTLEQLLALPLPPAQARFEIFGHYQLGRLYDIQGNREKAIAEYNRMLELPDQHDSHRLAREAIAKPITEADLE